MAELISIPVCKRCHVESSFFLFPPPPFFSMLMQCTSTVLLLLCCYKWFLGMSNEDDNDKELSSSDLYLPHPLNPRQSLNRAGSEAPKKKFNSTWMTDSLTVVRFSVVYVWLNISSVALGVFGVPFCMAYIPLQMFLHIFESPEVAGISSSSLRNLFTRQS